MKNSFDSVFTRVLNNCNVEYGFIKGNHTFFVIKAGLNGSIYGYENKYLDIAIGINEKYGYSVLCSSNPEGASIPFNSLEDIIDVVNKLADENGLKDPIVYYFGHSNGGLLGALYGKDYAIIKRMLLSNTPLFVNPLKTQRGIKEFKGEKLVMVYSEKDPSFKYTEIIGAIEGVELIIIKGQDHNYTLDGFDFRNLPEYILKKQL